MIRPPDPEIFRAMQEHLSRANENELFTGDTQIIHAIGFRSVWKLKTLFLGNSYWAVESFERSEYASKRLKELQRLGQECDKVIDDKQNGKERA